MTGQYNPMHSILVLMHAAADAQERRKGKWVTDTTAWRVLEAQVDHVVDMLFSPLILNCRKIKDYLQNKEAAVEIAEFIASCVVGAV